MLGKWTLAKNFATIVVLVSALLLGSLWLFVWQHLANEKERILAAASRDALNLAKAFEVHIRNIIVQADNDMQLLKMAYEKEGSSNEIAKLILTQVKQDAIRLNTGVTDEHGTF